MRNRGFLLLMTARVLLAWRRRFLFDSFDRLSRSLVSDRKQPRRALL